MTAANLERIRIARDYSETPGGRYREDGPDSGQQFREEILQPRFEQARREGVLLEIDLDGAEGYATSFLEEAFGGLARDCGAKAVLETLRFQCKDEPRLVVEIEGYIRESAQR